MKADLHCHTTMSDGSLGLEETIAQAKRYGIDYFAITDHDTLSSSSRAVVLGERYGVNVIPAVEFSTYDSKHGTKAHIICYNPEKPNRLEGLCLRTCEPVSYTHLRAHETGRNLVCRLLLEKKKKHMTKKGLSLIQMY